MSNFCEILKILYKNFTNLIFLITLVINWKKKYFKKNFKILQKTNSSDTKNQNKV